MALILCLFLPSVMSWVKGFGQIMSWQIAKAAVQELLHESEDTLFGVGRKDLGSQGKAFETSPVWIVTMDLA